MLRFLPVSMLAILFLPGCGGPPVDLVPVRGTVTFEDGTVPQGAVAKIYFEPVQDGPQAIRKVASGDIGPDGRFELMPRRPGDGVIPGEYKVFFAVEQTYEGRQSLLSARYTNVEQTPFEVTVEPRRNPPFDFELERH